MSKIKGTTNSQLREQIKDETEKHQSQIDDSIVGKKMGMISSRVYMDTPTNSYFYKCENTIANLESGAAQESEIIYQDQSLAERVLSKDDMLS